MDYFFRLTEEMLSAYEPMIPRWLLESRMDGRDTEFWAMESFGSPAGVAVLRQEDGDKILQYLYITERMRGVGRGSSFLLELMYQAHREGCRRFLTSYMQGEYPAFERLLMAYSFDQEEELIGSYRSSIQDLLQLPYLQGRYGNVKPLSQCTEESLRPLYRSLVELGEDMVDLPLKKQDYLAEFSAVTMEEGKPAGLLLVKQEGEQELSIPLMVNLSHNVAAPIEMIRFALQTASKTLPLETVCHFVVVNETLLKLLEKVGIHPAAKRMKRGLDLSYFEVYDQEVEDKLFEELLMTDYLEELL